MTQSAKVTLMNPVLAVNDLQLSLEYFQNALGFTVTWIWGEPTIRAGVALDGFELQLDASGGGPTGISVIFFHVTNLDEYYESCVSNGANIELEIADRSFNVRDFRVLDPSGNRLGFGAPLNTEQ
ncbi:VOC family protein [Pseudoalteromonas luteoviolacea]|uniref:VOC family protein n=1 Tax=Pseudoalteromonas luteoviolacea TaxID=43657 RepID=UPI001B38972B|nr:VOC family protein [Pseudoalteromonas luteoviolacea]MBQ4835819.1 VOC family protein [Pseudoalteromonas luteoviolacea]